MADRIVIGNKDGSTLGVFISKPGSNVFTASSNDLLFDSTSVRYGQIYAGGTQSSISSSGLTWTSGSKATLTYIPTYILFEQGTKIHTEEASGWGGDVHYFRIHNALAYSWAFTDSSIKPVGSGDDGYNENNSYGWWYGVDSQVVQTRTSNAVSFLVLRVPNGFGFMGNTYTSNAGVSTAKANHPSLGDTGLLWD
tara:strand:- start:61 stop:645 length:585 start_codon:yes stop_codon:yes gene_type:complete